MSPVRMSKIETPTRVVLAYKDALKRGDVDAILVLLSDDCTFEPAKNGLRLKGKGEIKAHLTELFAKTPYDDLKGIDLFQAGFHVIYRWELGDISGADIFKFREGLIVEKLSYVKK